MRSEQAGVTLHLDLDPHATAPDDQQEVGTIAGELAVVIDPRLRPEPPQRIIHVGVVLGGETADARGATGPERVRRASAAHSEHGHQQAVELDVAHRRTP
jgi:hypothetical protein